MNFQDKTMAKVDLKRFLYALRKRWWVVLLSTLLCAALVLSVAHFFVAPKYEASTMLYVNNTSLSIGSTSFSISDSALNAAQNLVKTYLVILNSRTTLETVIRAADLPYSYETLVNMLHSESVNGTEIFRVTVTSTNPEEAMRIANAIAVVLPGKIASVVDGSSVKVVDYAVMPAAQASPNYFSCGILGIAAGAFLGLMLLVFAELLNDSIRSEGDLERLYPQVPLLTVVPELKRSTKKQPQAEKGKVR